MPGGSALRRSCIPVVILALAMTGCASSQQAPSSQMAGVAPMLSVERFLQAANTRDLDAMARIFGTANGPIADQAGGAFGCAFRRMGSWIGLSRRCVSWTEIEVRMDAIARILRHDDYQIQSESSVAGRRHPTTRIGVDLVRGSERYQDVPFTVVQASEGRWLLEEIGLERITGARDD
jgi:hypothetical protein